MDSAENVRALLLAGANPNTEVDIETGIRGGRGFNRQSLRDYATRVGGSLQMVRFLNGAL